MPGATLIVTDAWARTGVLDRHDVKEYQPAGYKLAGSCYAELRAGAAQGHAGDLLHAGRRDVQGRQRATTLAGAALSTVTRIAPKRLRRFFFPA